MKNKSVFGYICLFMYWVVISLFYLSTLDPSPSILIEEYGKVFSRGEILYAGDKIAEEFTPKYDNLGIVAVRFQTQKRANDDTLVFRIKEKGNNNWYYTADYKADQFQDHQLFPFGFPIIEKSKGKTYKIEIESKMGSENNYVRIDNQIPTIISKHQYPLHVINFRSIQTYRFLVSKVINIISNFALIYPIIFYLLPLLTYFLLQSPLFSKNKNYNYSMIIVPVIIFLTRYILYFPQPPCWEATVILTWSVYLYKNKITPNINLVVSFGLLLFITYCFIENNYQEADAGVYWLLMMMIYAVIHRVIIELFGMKNVVGLRKIMSTIFSR